MATYRIDPHTWLAQERCPVLLAWTAPQRHALQHTLEDAR